MRGLKISLLVFFTGILGHSAFSQLDSISQPETTRTAPPQVQTVVPAPAPRVDSSRRPITSFVPDSAAIAAATHLRDSLLADSLQKLSPPVSVGHIDTSTYKKYDTHPWLPSHQPAIYMLIDYHNASSKDELFYVMVGVVFCLAFIRAGFPKYFRNLFVVFFQTNIRQKQTRDQLLQDNFASLLINLLFFISAGLYITLLIRYHHWTTISFWILALASVIALVLIYFGKYLFLLFSGWVFNAKEAAGSYIFMVFMVNKIMGILLVPFLLLFSFSAAPVVNVALTASLGMVVLLFAYRYFVSFNAIRSRLKVKVFHFFLYLCAVEVLPLLLIYKLLINYFEGSF